MNIILTGMRGSGKSAVARRLSGVLGLELVETDLLVENMLKISPAELIKKSGIKAFREAESAAITTLEAVSGTVISTGGGVVEFEVNMAKLKKLGKVIYLNCPPEILYSRIGEDPKRPLLTGTDNMLADLNNLFKKRKTLYELYADLIIDSGNLSIEQVVSKIKENI